MYTLTKTPKGKKFLYEAKDAEGKILESRLSTNPNFVAVMVCKNPDTGNIYVPSFFFSRLDLVGKGDSRHVVKYQIGIAQI